MFSNKVVPFKLKNAKGAEGCLKSHEKNDHNKAMKLWEDRKNHDQSSSTMIHLVQNRSEHRMRLEAVSLMIKFLIKNGLPLRGNEEVTDFNEGVCGGLYLNIMSDLVSELRTNLAEIAKKLRKNAKYTSPTIQNEVISVLKDIVEEKIAAEIREGELFTLMLDGSTDKNNSESIVCRYIVEGTSTDEMSSMSCTWKIFLIGLHKDYLPSSNVLWMNWRHL